MQMADNGQLAIPLTPAFKVDEWYWGRDLSKSFKLARAAMSAMKKLTPDDVVRTRRGDIVTGNALLKYLKSRKVTRGKA